MATIVWSPNAEDAYLAILEATYYFSASAALDLDKKLEKLLDRLKKFKHSCPSAPSLPSVRRCVVTQNVSLAYEIFGETIQILTIVDNRMENLL